MSLFMTLCFSAQHDCPNLRRAFAHPKHSTRQSCIVRNLKHLRCYLGVAALGERGLILNSSPPQASSRHSYGDTSLYEALFKTPAQTRA